jgi:hypothetical protein
LNGGGLRNGNANGSVNGGARGQDYNPSSRYSTSIN